MSILVVGRATVNTLATLASSGGSPTAKTLPDGVTGLLVRPCFSKYQRRSYISGGFSENMVVDEFGGIYPMGIEPPAAAAVLTTQGAGITGIAIGYYTLGQRTSGVLVYESDFSAGSNSLSLTNQGRHWASIQTTSPDSRVNVVRLYVSMDGADPRFAEEFALGSATHDENVATAALGETLESAGNRGIPPHTRFIIKYHNRLWFGGDPANPSRVWYSELDIPEAVGFLNFLNTRGGEYVTGLATRGDELVVFTAHGTQVIQGFDESDFQIQQVSPSVGCISHFGIVNIHDRLFFPSDDGVYIYDGGTMFRYAMDNLRDYWRKSYLANRSQYEDMVAGDDRYWQAYKLLWTRNVASVTAPTALTAVLGAGPGNLSNGDYKYKVTFADETGESGPGTVSATVTVINHLVNGIINLSAIPAGPDDTAPLPAGWRKIYRTTAGGGTYKFLVELPPGVSTYVDNVADANLGDAIPAASTFPVSFYYVGHYSLYDPETGGTRMQPDWAFDLRARKDSALGVFGVGGNLRDEFYTGSCDGYIRKENVETNDDDDGDAYQKLWLIRTAALLFSDVGGDIAHGKRITDLDLFLTLENTDWILNLYGGDEFAFQAITPSYTKDILASVKAGFAAKTNHHFKPPRVVGRSVTTEIKAPKALNGSFRGLQILWKEGPAIRRGMG